MAHDGLFLGLETPGQPQDEDKPGPLPGRAPGQAGGRRALAGIRDTDQSRRGGGEAEGPRGARGQRERRRGRGKDAFRAPERKFRGRGKKCDFRRCEQKAECGCSN